MGWHEVEAAFAEAVERGAIPGATVVVRAGADIAYEGAFGFRAIVPERSPMRLETVFDLSSLTKPLATLSLVGVAWPGHVNLTVALVVGGLALSPS